MRAGLNRLVVALAFASLAVVSGWVALEAVAHLVGRGSALLPVDYRSLWADIRAWDPGQAERTGLFAAVAALGAVLVVVQLRPGRAHARVEIVSSARGRVLLRVSSVAPFLRARLKDHRLFDGVGTRVRLRGRDADIEGAGRATRPWSPTEITQIEQSLQEDVIQLGLTPERVVVRPRLPKRGAARVQ